MAQNRLNNLALIAIESDIMDNINLDDLLKEFATIKARKVPLL